MKEPGHVEPLGLFGVIATEAEFRELRDSLAAQVGEISMGERAAVANYLRQGAIVFALMESTSDMLQDAFEVAGGSAVLTDGAYYWRRDTADYVERYGLRLPGEFVERGRRLDWSTPTVTHDDLLLIDAFLVEHGRRVGRPTA